MQPLRKAFRGYEPEQVDQLLSELKSKSDGLEIEVATLRDQNSALEAEGSRLQSALEARASEQLAVQEALISAHRQAEEVLNDARKEAEVLLQVAREAAARLQVDLRGRISDLNWQIERLSLQKQKFHNDFKSLLEGHLAQLSEPEQARLQLVTEEVPEMPVSAAEEDAPQSMA